MSLTRHHDVIVTRTTRSELILRATADCAKRREVLYFVEVRAWIVAVMTRADWSVE